VILVVEFLKFIKILFMKRLLFLLSIILITIVSSCQQDLPKDTPKWLKEKIKEIKKDIKLDERNGNPTYRWVAEYSKGSTIIYQYFVDAVNSPGTAEVFDADGNEICYFIPELGSSCGSYTHTEFMHGFQKVRTIWISK